VVEAKRLVTAGAIGEVRMISADCGFRTDVAPASRLFAPELGGGGLLDVGIYPISLVSLFLGRPDRVATLATLGETGVDEQSAFVLGFPGGQLATIYTAIRTKTPLDCVIMGTEGMLRLHPPFLATQKLTLTQTGGAAQELDIPFVPNGYQYQAIEVANCVRAGQLESALMPLDESLQIMATMDTIRAQWGLTYPME
jgi:predicted dehydrogenase